MNMLRELHQKHERLKKYVHEGFRYPLPKWGRFVMGCVYFTVPLVGGYAIMQWVNSKAQEKIGEHGEKLPVKEIQGFGNKTVDENGELHVVGAGGWGGGVRLAVSDQETQKRNSEKLRRFFRQQQRKRAKKEESEATTEQ